ncbi:MAG: gcvR [Gammaproteobacteria bacterium]|jgi:glycine cleavage system transcriptional repressor|nr:gcvR [Gammaproteobacteria bacterium]
MEYLTLTLIASEQDIVINEVIALSSKHNCRIQESRSCFLGADFSSLMRIAGNWSDIAKLEKALGVLASTSENLSLIFKRSSADNPSDSPLLPYLVQAIGLDTPPLVNEVAYFFANQSIQIIDLQTDPFQTSHSNTNMTTISMRVNVPASISIADLRERFMVLCDELNIDGILEPEKR